MYMHTEETPTLALRWNTYNDRIRPFLQQQWAVREGHNTRLEWRDIPLIAEAPGIKTPTSVATMD